MSPYRQDREPCEKCIERQREEDAVKNAQAKRKKRELTIVSFFDFMERMMPLFILLCVSVLSIFIYLDDHPSRTPPKCYRVVEKQDFSAELQLPTYRRWSKTYWEKIRDFDSVKDAYDFSDKHQLLMCK